MTVGLPRFLALMAMTLVSLLTTVPERDKVVAYVPNWVDLTTFSETIEYDKITHINIAFGNPTNPQGDLSFQKKNEFLITRAHARNVKILISIGGGAATNNELQARYFDLLTDSKRADFVARITNYVVDHHFDGLDVDLEGPAINKNYGAFIRDLSAALKPKGKLLTAALSQGYGGKEVPSSVFEHLDFVNVMAYDAAGSWNPNEPGQHSSIEFARRSVDYWRKRGLPESKTVLGVPFYGYGFGKAFRKRAYTYAEVVATYPDAAKVDQIGQTIWYNGTATIEAKTHYAIDHKLAGIMIWSLNQDVKGENSLLNAIDRTYRTRRGQTPAAR